MLANTELLLQAEGNQEQVEKIPSLNHSYVCAQMMKQLLQNDAIQPLPELTLGY